jgi:methylated-DNA-[protein]-cysteine S-methyltransferase
MTATETVYFTTFASPIGDLVLTSDGASLTGLHMGGTPEPGWTEDAAPLRPAVRQLAAYFAGELQKFDLPLRLDGTPFQKKVWAALRKIPYGTTISYAELGTRVCTARAARAVGSANGKNHVAVIVPCHRVIAADGTLGGFGGGLWRKEWLLNHERDVLGK